jgi:hypothetical protein
MMDGVDARIVARSRGLAAGPRMRHLSAGGHRCHFMKNSAALTAVKCWRLRSGRELYAILAVNCSSGRLMVSNTRWCNAAAAVFCVETFLSGYSAILSRTFAAYG